MALPVGLLFDWDLAWGTLAAVTGFVLIGYRWERTPFVRPFVDHHIRPVLDRLNFSKWDWRHFTLLAGIILALGASLQVEPFPCGSGTDDVGGFLANGQAFWLGRNPFLVTVCNAPDVVPYGVGSISLNAIGSLGGRAGIWVVWEALALLLIPATWKLGGSDRRYATYYVTTSILFVPIVTGQIDGASNAIVPVGLLLPLLVARSGWVRAGALAGLLSTARFPSLVPFWGATAGAARPRILPVVVSGVVFAAGVGITYLAWGRSYINYGLLGQVGRVDFSLNEFGFLFPNHWVSGGATLMATQAIALLAALGFVYYRKWAPLPAGALLIAVLALTTQFLSFNFLIWLLPISLTTDGARRWLWAIGLVGGIDYSWALAILAYERGIWWPSELFAAVLTVLLVGLLITLLRELDVPQESQSAEAPTSVLEPV